MSQCLVYFINYNCYNFVTQLTLNWIYRDLLQRDRALRAQQDKEFQASVSFIDHRWNWKHWIDLELCTKDSLICIHHLFSRSLIAICTRKTNIRYIDVNCHQKKKSWCIFFIHKIEKLKYKQYWGKWKYDCWLHLKCIL